MVEKITNANGFRAMAALKKAARDPRIKEIEGGGCDDGRVLIHAADGWVFSGYDSRTKGVGSSEDLRYAMSILVEGGR
ncbi:hypothetical protein EBS80_04255 [bacterium]|nr:hypothetical protein [bacterium]